MGTQINADENADCGPTDKMDQLAVVNHRLQIPITNPKNPHLAQWHTGCNPHSRREAHCIAS
ncbi:MAG TPA: hypothetical protein VFY60_06455 [Pyrinomonadaceae bacterium]|nr:hypothetical protein [Pyrinomonadaceae bacterium]